MKQPQLLHSQRLRRVPFIGNRLVTLLYQRVSELVKNLPDDEPDISIVIRARNNASQLADLLEDIQHQDYTGHVEVIVVNTQSTDDTAQVARDYGATLLTITQAAFSYPKALNLGFETAHHEWIYSLVDHSALSHTAFLKTANRWSKTMNLGGVYGTTLPNANATRSERVSYGIFCNFYLQKRAYQATNRDIGGGFLAANAALIRHSVWKELGGFNESYGAGGEDVALGAAMLKAGYTVISEPAMSVYHTHGLSPFSQLKQWRYWRTIMQPLAFDRSKLDHFRVISKDHQNKR